MSRLRAARKQPTTALVALVALVAAAPAAAAPTARRPLPNHVSVRARLDGGRRVTFRFAVAEASRLSLALRGRGRLVLVLRTAAGRRLACRCAPGPRARLSRRLPPGRYLVGARAGRAGGRFALRRDTRTITSAQTTIDGRRSKSTTTGRAVSVTASVPPAGEGAARVTVERLDTSLSWQPVTSLAANVTTGRAVVPFVPATPGVYRASTSFAGSRDFAPSTSAWATLVAAAPPAPPPPPPPSPPPRPLGLAVGAGPLFSDASFTAQERERSLELANQAGVTDMRVDSLWDWAEKTAPAPGQPDVYDWTYDDLVAGSLASHRIRWSVVLGYAPGWAARQPSVLRSPPADPATFARFSAAFARRYGPGGTFWAAHPELPAEPVHTYEVWNEPDLRGFWPPNPDPAAYAALFDATQAAVRHIQPDARMITGGVVTGMWFVAQMVAARPSLRTEISAVGYHPYSVSPIGLVGKVRAARRDLIAAGLGQLPLDLNELGWVTAPSWDALYADDAVRSGYVTFAARAVAAAGCNVDDVTLYSWTSSQQRPDHRDDWFGVVTRPGLPTATSAAWSALQHRPPTQPGSGC